MGVGSGLVMAGGALVAGAAAVKVSTGAMGAGKTGSTAWTGLIFLLFLDGMVLSSELFVILKLISVGVLASSEVAVFVRESTANGSLPKLSSPSSVSSSLLSTKYDAGVMGSGSACCDSWAVAKLVCVAREAWELMLNILRGCWYGLGCCCCCCCCDSGVVDDNVLASDMAAAFHIPQLEMLVLHHLYFFALINLNCIQMI